MSMPNRFWRAIEQIPGLATSAFEWRELLGSEWEWASQFLRPVQQQAETVPIGSDFHRVVMHSPERIVAVPPDGGLTTPLKLDDITIYELHWKMLARTLCAAFNFERTAGVINSNGTMVGIGEFAVTRSRKCPVHLCIQCDSTLTYNAIKHLVVIDDEPMVVLTPGRIDDEDMRQILRLRGACHVCLADDIEIDADGNFSVNASAQRTLDSFKIIVEQYQSEKQIGDPYRFQRNGRVWILTFDGITRYIPHKDASGLAYIQHLLARPNQEIPVERLEEMVEGDVSLKAVSTGETVIDGIALDSYFNEIQQVQEELEVSQKNNDLAAQDRFQEELDRLTEHMHSAQGLNNRIRKVGDDTERLRTKITQSIRRAIDILKNESPRLSTYLDNAINLGKIMNYHPDTPNDWVF